MHTSIIKSAWAVLLIVGLTGCAGWHPPTSVEISALMKPEDLIAAIKSNGGRQAYSGWFLVDDSGGTESTWEFRDYDAVLWVHELRGRVDWMRYFTKEGRWNPDRRLSDSGKNIRTLRLNPTTKTVSYEGSPVK